MQAVDPGLIRFEETDEALKGEMGKVFVRLMVDDLKRSRVDFSRDCAIVAFLTARRYGAPVIAALLDQVLIEVRAVPVAN